jgi:hypothetical protein
VILYIVSLGGGILYLFLNDADPILVGFIVLIERYGVSGSFNTSYLGTASLNPAMFASTVVGFCNVFARLVTVLAP